VWIAVVAAISIVAAIAVGVVVQAVIPGGKPTMRAGLPEQPSTIAEVKHLTTHSNAGALHGTPLQESGLHNTVASTQPPDIPWKPQWQTENVYPSCKYSTIRAYCLGQTECAESKLAAYERWRAAVGDSMATMGCNQTDPLELEDGNTTAAMEASIIDGMSNNDTSSNQNSPPNMRFIFLFIEDVESIITAVATTLHAQCSEYNQMVNSNTRPVIVLAGTIPYRILSPQTHSAIMLPSPTQCSLSTLDVPIAPVAERCAREMHYHHYETQTGMSRPSIGCELDPTVDYVDMESLFTSLPTDNAPSDMGVAVQHFKAAFSATWTALQRIRNPGSGETPAQIALCADRNQSRYIYDCVGEQQYTYDCVGERSNVIGVYLSCGNHTLSNTRPLSAACAIECSGDLSDGSNVVSYKPPSIEALAKKLVLAVVFAVVSVGGDKEILLNA
jgi:hypothetical protein